ncbi:hypothetical protein BD413DRAFT_500556 [Trametes elegans]|nr:hypothetical protein BD413DRAFT_500556 [Trametes elegans]
MDSEVRFIWGWARNFSWAKLVFLLNRYTALLLFLLSLVPLLPADSQMSCTAVNNMIQILNAVLYTVWAAFSGLRIYAISDHNRFVTSVVTVLALVPVGTNIYLATKIQTDYELGWGCEVQSLIPLSTYQDLAIATRAVLIASEAIVIIVTWTKTWCDIHTRRTHDGQTPFITIIFRQGMLYFAVVLPLNALQIAMLRLESDTFSLALQFLNALMPVLISRWYFSLDDVKRRQSAASLPSLSGRVTTSLRFLGGARTPSTGSVPVSPADGGTRPRHGHDSLGGLKECSFESGAPGAV